MIRIIADSTCDLPIALQRELNIDVLPLTIRFGDRVFKDGVDLSHAQFYKMMEKANALPSTSQINPGEFEAKFQTYIDAGDDILGIFLASDLSGTFQSAVIAANSVCPERIFTVDCRSASFATALLIKEAVRLRDEGKASAGEIAKHVQQLANRVHIFAMVDTLKYLRMGGRLSGAAAVLGTALQLHPIMEVYDGRINNIGKARGELGAFKAMLKEFKETAPDYRFGVAFGNAAAEERMQRFSAFMKPFLKKDTAIYQGEIGAVVGAHTGPGVVGIAYIAKE